MKGFCKKIFSESKNWDRNVNETRFATKNLMQPKYFCGGLTNIKIKNLWKKQNKKKGMGGFHDKFQWPVVDLPAARNYCYAFEGYNMQWIAKLLVAILVTGSRQHTLQETTLLFFTLRHAAFDITSATDHQRFIPKKWRKRAHGRLQALFYESQDRKSRWSCSARRQRLCCSHGFHLIGARCCSRYVAGE